MQDVAIENNSKTIMVRNKIAAIFLISWAFLIWFPNFQVGIIGVNDIAALFAIVFAAPSILSMRGGATLSTFVIFFCLIAIFTLSFLQISWVSDPAAAARFSLRYGLIIAVCLAALALQREFSVVESVSNAYVLGGVLVSTIVALDAYFGLLSGITYEQSSNRRSMGFLEHPNQLGIFLTIALPVLFCTKISRYKKALCIIILFIGMLFSGSKTNLLLFMSVLALAPIVAGGFTFRSFATQSTILLMLVAGIDLVINLIVAFFRTFNEGYADRFEKALGSGSSADTLVSRYDLWDIAIELGRESPFIGIGAGQANFYLPYSHAHSFLAHYFMTLGVPGAALIVLLFVTLLLSGSRSSSTNTSRYIVLGVVAFFSANLLSDSIAGRSIDVLGLLTVFTLSKRR